MTSSYQTQVFEKHLSAGQGHLHYVSIDDNIKLTLDKLTYDITAAIRNTISKLNSQVIIWQQNGSKFVLALADEGLTTPDSLILRQKTKDHGADLLVRHDGFTNLTAYMSNFFQNINARMMYFKITPLSLTFWVDENEEQYALTMGKNGDCKIDDGKEREVCKVGDGKDCCIFLTVSGDGFQCTKFSSTGRILLDALTKGELNAGRIGSCKLVGTTKSAQAGS